jgi:hypothetical protein
MRVRPSSMSAEGRGETKELAKQAAANNLRKQAGNKGTLSTIQYQLFGNEPNFQAVARATFTPYPSNRRKWF